MKVTHFLMSRQKNPNSSPAKKKEGTTPSKPKEKKTIKTSNDQKLSNSGGFKSKALIDTDDSSDDEEMNALLERANKSLQGEYLVLKVV